MSLARYIILQTPEQHEPGSYFPEELENSWLDREELGLRARVIARGGVLLKPSGRRARNTQTGEIGQVYHPIGKPPPCPTPPSVKTSTTTSPPA